MLGQCEDNVRTMGNICSLTRLLAGRDSHHPAGVQSGAAVREPAKPRVALHHFLQ